MLIGLPDLLRADEAASALRTLDAVHPGGAPGGLPVTDAIRSALDGALVGDAVFQTAAVPYRIGDATILGLGPGDSHDYPLDPIVPVKETGAPLRVDLFVTVFLTPLEHYEGGDLVVTTDAGRQQIRLPSGRAALYSASARRRVTEVTRGVRWAIDIPIQSMIRDDEQREILAEMWSVMDWLDHMPKETRAQSDRALNALKRARADLLRMWVDV